MFRFQRLLGALILLSPCAASAHGGKFGPEQVLVEPGDASHVVISSDVWGYLETKDAGKSWAWFCAEAYGGNTLSLERKSMALLGGGDLFIAAYFDGLVRSRGSLCEFAPVPFFEAEDRCEGTKCLVNAVGSVPEEPRSVVALTSNGKAGGGIANVVWMSSDAGESWAPLGADLPTDFAGASVAVGTAAGMPPSLYVTGLSVLSQTERVVVSSIDGGATWTTAASIDASGAPPQDLPPVLRVHGVSPTDPAVAFFWLDYLGTNAKDRVYATYDGGKTVEQVFEGEGTLPGFAFSADGATVFLGGPTEGLYRASSAEIATKGQAAFDRLSGDPVLGFAITPEGLLAGRDEFAPPPNPAVALGVSTDDGATFAPKLSVCDVALAACPGGSQFDQCTTWYYGETNFRDDFQNPGRCTSTGAGGAGSGGPDAGAGGATAPSSKSTVSGGCSTRSRSQLTDTGVVALVVAITGLARRLRRGRRVPRSAPSRER